MHQESYELFLVGDESLEINTSLAHTPTIHVVRVLSLAEAMEQLKPTNEFDVIVVLPDVIEKREIASLEYLQDYYHTPVITLVDDCEVLNPFAESGIMACLCKEELNPRQWRHWLRQARFVKKQQQQLLTLQRTREELAASKYLIDKIFTTIPDSINIFSVLNNKLLYGNRRITEVLGYTDEDIDEMGVNLISILTHPDDLELYRAYQNDVINSKNSQILTILTRLKAKDGEWHWIETNHSVFKRDKEGNPLEILGLARDITTHKLIEEQLIDALKIEAELGEMKSQFIRVTSHEFRTPLTIIQSTLETLIRFSDRLTAEEKDERFIRIKKQIRNMIKMVDDLLSIVEMDDSRSQYPPVAVDIEAHCQALITDFESVNNLSGRIRLHVSDIQEPINIRETLFNYIYNNLLSNAHKYSPDEDDCIDISIRCDEAFMYLDVQDSGAGIADGDLSHIFETFYRGDNTSGIPGTGLGLHIVKRALDLYGGTSDIQTKVDQGTTVHIRLPLL